LVIGQESFPVGSGGLSPRSGPMGVIVDEMEAVLGIGQGAVDVENHVHKVGSRLGVRGSGVRHCGDSFATRKLSEDKEKAFIGE